MEISFEANPKVLYQYQEDAITQIFAGLERLNSSGHLLYQLPTGGGKTVIFSEIVKRYLNEHNQKVIVLTHRVELSNQTSATLKKQGIKNKIINSSVKKIAADDPYSCYVAMVETMHHRIEAGNIDISGVGLVIIDEAHHNSFKKMLEMFGEATIVGVTATPLSSDSNAPMRSDYHELILGEQIPSLIAAGFLAKPTNWRYDVELAGLQTGAHGDFTVSTSDELYSSAAMMDLLLHSYQEHAKGKKTLIFNNGIHTSKNVCRLFTEAGYVARHLDNHHSSAERAEILQWFKKTKGAILSSVSILTTGFDEPSIQAVILNRATTSLSLYHQMIGRGSRRLPQKKSFVIVDLGNNTERFGEWHEPVDWQEIFDHPEIYQAKLADALTHHAHVMPAGTHAKFPNSLQIAFDVQEAHRRAVEQQLKPKTVIRESLRQHVMMCVENASTIPEALLLIEELDKEVNWRIRQYAKCLGHTTSNYKEWLAKDYKERLFKMVKKMMYRKERIIKVA